MKLKILHIVKASYPSFSGYTIRTERILDSLNTRNIQVSVAGSIFSKRLDQLKLGSVFIHNQRKYYQLLNRANLRLLTLLTSIPKLRVFSKYLIIIINAFLLKSKIEINQFDIIHGHSTFPNGICALFLARLYKKKFIYDVHALGVDAYNPKSFRYKIERFFENYILHNYKRNNSFHNLQGLHGL